jgi:hypothetical protein
LLQYFDEKFASILWLKTSMAIIQRIQPKSPKACNIRWASDDAFSWKVLIWYVKKTCLKHNLISECRRSSPSGACRRVQSFDLISLLPHVDVVNNNISFQRHSVIHYIIILDLKQNNGV